MLLRGHAPRREILQGKLQRRFDGLRAAGRIHDVAKTRPASVQKRARELFECVARKQIAIGAGDLVKLRGDGRVHLTVAVTDAERRGTARAVEISAAVFIE